MVTEWYNYSKFFPNCYSSLLPLSLLPSLSLLILKLSSEEDKRDIFIPIL